MIDENSNPIPPLEETVDPNAPVVRCIMCSELYTAKQIDSLRACLKCGTQALPLPITGDLKAVEVNWLELMILVEWAENYANILAQQTRNKTSVDIVGAIARRLSVHRKPGQQALMVAERVMEQRKTNGDAPRIIVPPPGVGGKMKLN